MLHGKISKLAERLDNLVSIDIGSCLRIFTGLFLLNNSANKFDKIVLAYIETMDLPYSKISMVIGQDKIRKEFHQLFKGKRIILELNAT